MRMDRRIIKLIEPQMLVQSPRGKYFRGTRNLILFTVWTKQIYLYAPVENVAEEKPKRESKYIIACQIDVSH